MSNGSSDEITELPVVNKSERSFGFKRRRTVRYSDDAISPKQQKQLPLGQLMTCGKIERIILKNVLCHEHLEYAPSDRFNIIQGKNGSGKSSIVAGIIAGLGGASRTTDRGTLKNLIMWNKSYAVVEIHLRNCGISAYKSDLYGETIIVERRILATSSTYKLKSANGKVISQKKEDLVRILDSFNINIDNPVTVLTQERAKTFLNTTNPRDLYKFFMLSTGLQQLKEDYQQLNLNLELSAKLIHEKKENLQIQFKEVKAWENKVTAINTLAKKRQKLVQLRRERQWAEVSEMEVKLEAEKKVKGKYEDQVGKIDLEMKRFELKKKEIEADRKQVDQKLDALVSVRLNFQADLDSAKKGATESKLKHRDSTYKLNNCEQDCRNKQEDVDVLRRKLQTDYSEAHSKYERELKEMQDLKQKIGSEIQQMKQHYDTEYTHSLNLPNLDEAMSELSTKKMEEKVIRQRLKMLEDELRSFTGAKNPYLVFGQKMPQIIASIEQEHKKGSFTCRPIGPLGSHIKVRDSQWAHIAEKVLGNLMTSFLVNDSKDMNLLKKIFQSHYRSGEQFPSITFTKFRNQRHNADQFEAVHSHYFSLWSILEVQDDQVANALLDQRQVESILLIPTAHEAGNLLKNAKTVPKNCVKAYTLHGDLYFPDPNYRIYSGDGNRRTTYLEISLEEKKKDVEQNIRETKKEVENTRAENLASEKELQQIQASHRESNEKIKSFRKMMDKLRTKLCEINNNDIPAPHDVYQLKKDLEENETLLQEVQKKHLELTTLSNESKEKYTEARTKFEKTISIGKEYDIQGEDLEREHGDIQSRITENKKSVKAYSNKKAQIESILNEEVGKNVELLEKQLNRKMQVLQEANCERTHTRRRIEDIERELTSLQAIIQTQEDQHGDVDAIISTWKEKKDIYEAIQIAVKEQRNYISKLREAINARTTKNECMKYFQLIFLKTAFGEKLQIHKLKGDIEVDYEKEFLKIQTIKEGSKGTTLQSLAMMSGGERSFATICFISALWDLIASPVRILDEFDIFMDIILRKKAIDMLMNCVNKKYQYILVSPLDYQISSDKAACFRVPSPERRKKRTAEAIQ